MKKKLLIAGGTGLIGTALSAQARAEGWEVTLLSRTPGPDSLTWDPKNLTTHTRTEVAYDAIVNLAGASIAGQRWTEKRKKLIRDSRVDACKTLETYLKSGTLKTKVYIGVSGVGIYGDRGNVPVDESTPIDSGPDWMISTVRDWEAGHQQIAQLGIRTSVLRLGIVLSRQGGALKEVLMTAPFGILTYFGSGRQIWPWIHIDDVTGIMMKVIDTHSMQGLYQANAPQPVSNKAMTQALARQFSPKRFVLSVPVWAIRLMLGSMHSVVMQGCNSLPVRLQSANFAFRYSTIEKALGDLFKR